MTEHQSLTIDHCPPPYRGHTKEQSTHGCTLGYTTIKNNRGPEDISSIMLRFKHKRLQLKRFI